MELVTKRRMTRADGFSVRSDSRQLLRVHAEAASTGGRRDRSILEILRGDHRDCSESVILPLGDLLRAGLPGENGGVVSGDVKLMRNCRR